MRSRTKQVKPKLVPQNKEFLGHEFVRTLGICIYIYIYTYYIYIYIYIYHFSNKRNDGIEVAKEIDV